MHAVDEILNLGPERGLEESLDSLESLESGRILLNFPQSGGSLKSLKFSEKTPFPNTLFPNPINPLPNPSPATSTFSKTCRAAT